MEQLKRTKKIIQTSLSESESTSKFNFTIHSKTLNYRILAFLKKKKLNWMYILCANILLDIINSVFKIPWF